MERFKSVLIVALSLVLGLSLHLTGLPITLIDIFMIPLGTLCLGYGITALLSKDSQVEPLDVSGWSLFGFSLFSAGLMMMGAWLSVMGWRAPFELFSSIKGAAHGYTLVIIGVLLACFSAWMLYVYVRQSVLRLMNWCNKLFK